MPIKPENKKRYPANWKQIRAAILKRAGNRCERCNVRNYAVGYWTKDRFEYVRGNPERGETEYPDSYADARDFAGDLNEWADDLPKVIIIVLTVAHLDHTPANCDPANLQALCQRCHLRYDANLQATNSAKTRRGKKRNFDLFEM